MVQKQTKVRLVILTEEGVSENPTSEVNGKHRNITWKQWVFSVATWWTQAVDQDLAAFHILVFNPVNIFRCVPSFFCLTAFSVFVLSGASDQAVPTGTQ